MQRTLIQALFVVFLSAPATAQVRAPNQMFTDIDLLFDILSAVVNRIDVDDPNILAAEFPNRTFEDFDRDRDGAFMTFGAALGLYDLNLAIEQFNHDQVDADGDGLLGFYELECAYAAFGRQLNPEQRATYDGRDDATVDCDGDGASNRNEIEAGTNPLDSNDMPRAAFEVSASPSERPLTTAGGDWQAELTKEVGVEMQGGTFRLEGQFASP